MKSFGNIAKDGQVRAAVSEGLTVTQAVGTDVIFNSGSTTGYAAAFDSSTGKVVIAFSDGTDGSKGKAIVGTVDPSNNSISFGSEVVFQNSEITGDQMDCVFDSNANKVVIFYTDTVNSRSGAAIVGTVSGTSISFGTKATFESGGTSFISACFDSNLNKLVVFYRDEGNSNYGTAAVGTVSGTGISFGSPVVFNSANTAFLGSSFDSNAGKILVVYKDVGNSNYGNSIVGTVSGTSISFGSEVTFLSANGGFYQSIFDSSANKNVVLYDNPSDNNYGYARVGTISGTSVSYGTAAKFETGQAEYMRGVFDSNAGKIAIVYKDGSNSNRPTFVSGTVSGTDISFDTPVVLKAVEGVIYNPGVAYDSTNKRVVAAYADTTANPDNGLAQVISVGYTSATGGTIADGKPVIVNANGTVSSVSQTAASLGTESAFNSETSSNFAAVFDSSNNKHIIVYRWHDGSSTTMRYVVATVASDGSVSFGTDAVVESSDNQQISACFDSTNNRIVVAYRRGADSDHGYALVGSLSGTTVTWGSPTEFQNGLAKQIDLDFDSTSGKVVIAFAGTSEYGTAIVGTVSGTSISFGSPVVHRSARSQDNRVVYDSTNNKTVIGFMDQDDGEFGKAVVGTVSGTSISFGSAVTFHSGEMNRCGGTFDSANGKVVFVYSNKDNSQRVTAIVGTVSGTSISFGSAVVVATDGTYGEAAPDNVVFDSNSNKVIAVLPYTVSGSYSNRGFVFPLSVSGTTIVADTGTDFAGATAVSPAISFDSNVNKSLISFGDGGNSEYATAVSFAPLSGNLTTENFVGFMDGAALDGTNGEILSSCSIARNQTSLTPGQTYFVTGTGTLSTTAGSPSVTAGTAISSKELIVKG
jgi:hypothetical protein